MSPTDPGGCAAVEQAAKNAGHNITVPFEPGRTDASLEQTDTESFAVLEPTFDGFRNYPRAGEKLAAEELLVERAFMLNLSPPEMAVLVGGMCRLPATWDQLAAGFASDMGPPLCQLWDHPEDPPTPAEKTFGWASHADWRGGPMAFREVSVVQVKEALRRWLKGEGERPIAHGVGIDRKTVRRYIAAAVELGVDRSGGEEQLSDELIGQVLERVRPHRLDGHGEAWRSCSPRKSRSRRGSKQDLTVVKIGILLARRGVVVPHADAGPVRRRALWSGTAHGHGPGGRPAAGRRAPGRLRPPRVWSPTESAEGVHGLIFTACFSRHQFVWPTFLQTTEEVIGGFEAAWGYFGGVFPVVIPDNMKSIVIEAENTAPRFNDVFLEYAQSRGFVIDAARVATPTDKPGWNGLSTTCSTTSSPARPSSTWPTAGRGPRPGAARLPACASTARPSAGPSRRFAPRSGPLLLACRARPSTCRRGPIPRSTGTSTSRWTRRSTRSRTT